MNYTISHEARDNGAYTLLAAKGSRLSVLMAMSMYTDSYGNTWATSKPDASGALNRLTALSHPTIAGKGGARRWLRDHGAIRGVHPTAVAHLYDGAPEAPGPNSMVWHITGDVAKCGNNDCECQTTLTDDVVPFFYDGGGPDPDAGKEILHGSAGVGKKTLHEINTNTDSFITNVLKESGGADAPTTTPFSSANGNSAGLSARAAYKHMFGAVARVTGMAPTKSGDRAVLGMIARKMHKAGLSPDVVEPLWEAIAEVCSVRGYTVGMMQRISDAVIELRTGAPPLGAAEVRRWGDAMRDNGWVNITPESLVRNIHRDPGQRAAAQEEPDNFEVF